jgi:hypothetical protein
MSYPVFYVEANDTLPVVFSTFDGGTGASITLTGLLTSDIEIYKDGVITAGNERTSDNGYALIDTDGIDLDSMTGIHGVTIDLSDNSDAGFYAVGSWYTVIVNSVTIDAQTVRFIACAFRIVSATRGMAGTALPDAAANAAGGLPISTAGSLDLDAMNTNINDIETDTNELQTDWTNAGRLDAILDLILADTAELQGDWTNTGRLDTILDAILVDTASLNDTKIPQTLNLTALGNIGIDWANVENKTAVVDLSATDIQLCDTITTYTGNTVQTGDAFARLGAPAGASIAADLVASIAADLVTIAGYTDILDNATSGNAKIATDVAAILVDTAALADTTRAEPGSGAPSATTTMMEKVDYLYKAWRNKSTQTSSTYSLYADDGTTVDQTATVSKTSSTVTKGEVS